jgi:hypothetical protein
LAKVNGIKFFREKIALLGDNVLLLLKGLISTVLLILGPLIALMIRFFNGNWFAITVTGVIFEIIGVILFWVVIKKDYNEIEQESQPILPKRKGKKR